MNAWEVQWHELGIPLGELYMLGEENAAGAWAENKTNQTHIHHHYSTMLVGGEFMLNT